MNNQERFRSFAIKSSQHDLLSRQRLLPEVLQYLGLPLAVTGILVTTSVNSNSLVQVVLAFVLLLIPWISYQWWRESNSYGLPIFAIISGLHWLYFAVALFWGDRIAPVWYSSDSLVTEEAVTNTLLMAVLGVSAIGLGIRRNLTKFLLPKQRATPALKASQWDYIRILLVVGTLASFFPNAVYIFGEAGRQWIIAIQNTVPLLAFLLLLRRYFRNEATQADKLLLLLYIVGRLFTGLASGWSGTVFYLGVAIGLVYLLERKTIPKRTLILVMILTLFLQPGKADFRQAYWYNNNNQIDLLARISYWLDESFQDWNKALSDPSGEQIVSYLRGSILRVSLLTHAANVHDKTPSVVPHQEGRLYIFSAAGLVPRFLWPDKPSGNDANRFYQVAFGVTSEAELGNVSIAIGFMTEAYISFGWFGVLIIMFLLGNFYRGVHDFFFQSSDAVLMPSIGVLSVVWLMRIETQLGLYIVSTIQAIVVSLLVLLPITSTKSPLNPTIESLQPLE